MNSRTITYMMLVVGAITAFYAQVEAKQNTYLLIGGFAALMIGLYRLSKGISSKKPNQDSIKSEEEK